MQKLISALFTLLLILVPVVFYPYTSEVFEFNKLVLVYLFTVFIVGAWLTRMLQATKFVFKRTLLDIPLLLFLISQVLATFTSIDVHTSIFGYYSRFNGGLLSTVCYCLLYWAWVSNVTRDKSLQILKYFLYTVAFVSVWGILEHFGGSISCIIIRNEFNTDCWVQDVQTRVFASMGQPNWLAAMLVASIPLGIYFLRDAKTNFGKLGWQLVLVCNFAALLYTKSRSGLLAFVLTFVVLIAGFITTSIITKSSAKISKSFLVTIGLCAALLLGIGSIWTPSLDQLLTRQNNTAVQESAPSIGPALETGGTESGEIRQIVWKGALELWKKYPLTGSGVETFGYAYYETRPKEHNLVSEWDFIYNKAHNEYLNYLSTSGIFGAGTYIVLILTTLILFLMYWSKSTKSKDIETSLLIVSLTAGYISLLATNFFGFSVVTTSLLFFLLPGFAVSSLTKEQKPTNYPSFNTVQKIALLVVVLMCVSITYLIVNYWRADYFYSQSKMAEQEKDYPAAIKNSKQALELSTNEAIYHDQYARLLADYTLAYKELKEDDTAGKYLQATVAEIDIAKNLSPRNVNLQRSRANIYIDLAAIDSNFLYKAIETLEETKNYSPTDAKVYYKLGLAYLRIVNLDKALENFREAVNLKPNYLDARMALGLSLIDANQNELAKQELEYILKNLDPNNKLVKEELDRLKF